MSLKWDYDSCGNRAPTTTILPSLRGTNKWLLSDSIWMLWIGKCSGKEWSFSFVNRSLNTSSPFSSPSKAICRYSVRFVNIVHTFGLIAPCCEWFYLCRIIRAQKRRLNSWKNSVTVTCQQMVTHSDQAGDLWGVTKLWSGCPLMVKVWMEWTSLLWPANTRWPW